VHAAAGFARPNIHEALAQLQDAGVAESRGRGSELLYAIRREDWPRLLGIEDEASPRHQDRIQTLGPLRLVLRWLYDEHTETLSDYMLASEARVLLGKLESDLRFAGNVVGGQTTTGAEYWVEFLRTIEGVIGSLKPLGQPQKMPVRSCSIASTSGGDALDEEVVQRLDRTPDPWAIDLSS